MWMIELAMKTANPASRIGNQSWSREAMRDTELR